MRRKDREVTDKKGIQNIMERCPICRVAFTDDEGAFIVPMNYGYQWEEELTLYFHSALEGRKIAALQANPSVFFEMDIHHGIQEGATACQYSAYFESVMGTGKASLVSDVAEKKKALALLMHHQAGKDFVFDEQDVASVAVIKVVADSVTAKKRVPKE